MNKGSKASILIGLTGIGVIVAGWAISSMREPGLFTVGRVSLVIAVYCFIAAIVLWRMFKPKGIQLPEYVPRDIDTEPPYPYNELYRKKKEKDGSG